MDQKSNLDEQDDDEGDDHFEEGDYDDNEDDDDDDEVTCWKQPSQVLTLRIKHAFRTTW